MMYSEVLSEKMKIRGYGTRAAVCAAKEMLSSLSLTGNERVDRLKLQEALDRKENKDAAKCQILYDGNYVVSFSKTVNEFQRLWKANSLTKMTNAFYEFCHVTLSDSAHYNKSGYIDYYRDDPVCLFMEFLQKEAPRVPGWHSDVNKIMSAIDDFVSQEERKYA